MTHISEEIQDNRERIIQCAIELFYAKGYEGVGVQEIANMAGITKPTLYYYFKSKYGLLESVLAEYIPSFIALMKEALDGSETLEDGLNKMARVYLSRMIENRKFTYMFLALVYSPKDSDSYKAVTDYSVEIFGIFNNLFIKYSDYLGNMNGRSYQFTMGFMGILNYYLLFRQYDELSGEYSDMDKDVHLLVHQFMHGIFS